MNDLVVQLLPLVALLALMYFMMIRPQQQQQKKRQEMLNALQAGARVVTIGGLHGTIQQIDDKMVDLKVSSGVVLRFNRSAVAQVLKDEESK